MARIILITGGSRSGKSTYAQTLAESVAGIRTYVATCPIIDEEMEKRIRKHREMRHASAWQTIEETKDLTGALKRAMGSRVILVDCLTLWVNNLMYEAELQGKDITEEDIAMLCKGIIEVCNDLPGTVIFVTNEVGMGIVPENPASRLFRDLTGRCNQMIADRADAVTFMISGLPVNIKGDKII
ncbi:MAG TPA: bifunctional adenosylcobinamide kinase/adenosylcobinamide-phosphate guanylyltransferase [Syntrophales bacterium]|nr:bifunctional adenosylcobinamide kinase/adenosylcobinamide-phosphate guanylyltransferase [Syntrophales bacterium]